MSLRKRIFKVLFLGEGDVGKTSLLRRHTDGLFIEDLKMTVGVDFRLCEATYGSWSAVLQIWDLAGQMHFRDLVSLYFSGTHVAIAVFDVMKPFTLKALNKWITDLFTTTGEIPLVFVGNKIDLRQAQSTYAPLISSKEGLAFAGRFAAPYIETSAKNGVGVKEVFDQVTHILAKCFPSAEHVVLDKLAAS